METTNATKKLELYQDCVILKFHLLNSLFLTLPYSNLSDIGQTLPLFSRQCREGLQQGKTPTELVATFFEETLSIANPEEQEQILFLFLQLVERQVLLFDAVEHAGAETLYKDDIRDKLSLLSHKLPQGNSIRLVLTAHPTQFYPNPLLSLIQEIKTAVENNDIVWVRNLLLQLGKTSFKNLEPPTVEQEAKMLLEQFGDVFYETFLSLSLELGDTAPRFELGFWPGGDRDGNPYVNHKTTRHVALMLNTFAKEKLHQELDKVRKRLTFKNTLPLVEKLREKLETGKYLHAKEMEEDVQKLLDQIDKEEGGLFRDEVVRLQKALSLFGFGFASLDLRESSDVIHETICHLFPNPPQDAKDLEQAKPPLSSEPLDNNDFLQTLTQVQTIQTQNGLKGLHRLIISHTEQVDNLLEAFYLSRWFAEDRLDIVPLFETIEDLQNAPDILEKLLAYPPYRKHLTHREETQTVMLGFSDGTKDGGYVTCNVEIQTCKETLYSLAKKHKVNLIFFDGRGGPPARGGGLTHQYYRVVGEKIPQDHLQLTIQGQTISSHFGSKTLASYFLLELMPAFLQKADPHDDTEDKQLLEELSKRSFAAYKTLREDPLLIPFLTERTPMTFLGKLNIASRPPVRHVSDKASVNNLRAISFVSAWSLMKLNVPAFYGLGLALESFRKEGRLEELQNLYKRSSFLQVLLSNSSQALRKSLPSLTQNLCLDPRFGSLWQRLQEECQRTEKEILLLQDEKELALENPLSEKSIMMREELSLPLLVIQQAALTRWEKDPDDAIAEKLIQKAIAPSINASRNSA